MYGLRTRYAQTGPLFRNHSDPHKHRIKIRSSEYAELLWAAHAALPGTLEGNFYAAFRDGLFLAVDLHLAAMDRIAVFQSFCSIKWTGLESQ